MVTCKSCNGTGAAKGTSKVTCDMCHGHGTVQTQQGFFAVQQTCPKCHGAGEIIKEPCLDCLGQGRIKQTKKLSVKIPAGIDHGDQIRLSGEGEAGDHGGPNGDLFVQMRMKQHDIFTREGHDLFSTVPIDFVTACLGGEIEVPVLDGKVKLKIPAETQSGKMFRLRGKGVKPLKSSVAGDLLCKVEVETPVNLGPEHKTRLEAFRQSLDDGQNHSPRATNWFKAVKDFFKR